MVGVIFGSKNAYWFTKSGTTYTPLYAWLGVSLVEDTTFKTLTFTRTIQSRTEVTVFNSFSAPTNPGSLARYTDERGITTMVVNDRQPVRRRQRRRRWERHPADAICLGD
jgi:hypothetical protein